MQDLSIDQGEFMSMGGTELAPMSTTTKLEVAVQYSDAAHSLLFKVRTDSFMQRGALLDFLSCMPHEREVCYPPFTYLKPTGQTQHVELSDELRCIVVEVVPHVG